jgi:spermidine/putrescine transport system permease protein
VTAPPRAPALPATRSTERPVGFAQPRGDRSGRMVEGAFRAHAVLVYAFLYLPIVIVIAFAFNANRLATIWTGFSTEWFGVALGNGVVRKALGNSFIVAFFNATLATAFGTMAALGLQRVPRPVRLVFDVMTYVSIIVPEIVIALATLVFFATAFDVINPILASGDPGAFKLGFGHATIVAAHVLFNTSLVLLLVRARLSGMDRTHVEASYDLFATPWRTFRQITFPQLLPAIVAGFLLSFTFSFDDYVITSFVSGPGSSTLPLYVFGQVKRGVSPETNAVAAMIFAFTIGTLLIGQFILIRNARRTGTRGSGSSMAGIITEQSS